MPRVTHLRAENCAWPKIEIKWMSSGIQGNNYSTTFSEVIAVSNLQPRERADRSTMRRKNRLGKKTVVKTTLYIFENAVNKLAKSKGGRLVKGHYGESDIFKRQVFMPRDYPITRLQIRCILNCTYQDPAWFGVVPFSILRQQLKLVIFHS